jgi:hypothetical protein
MLNRYEKNRRGCTTGALVVVDDSGFIREVLIMATDDRQAAMVVGALARVAHPKAWRWLHRLIGRR